jgi:uncharacterized protein YwqG
MARTIESLRAEARRRRLPNVLKNLERLASPGVRLLARVEDDEARLAPGASKFWGRPDLPAGLAWPEAGGKPLAFLGQVDLAAAASHAAEGALPPGRAYFFYDLGRMPWGFDPADRPHWRVLFDDGPAEALRRAEPPPESFPGEWREGGESPPSPLALSFEPRVFLPGPSDVDVLELGLPDEEYENYVDWLDALDEEDAEAAPESGDHRLLGCPFLVQSDMRLECQLASNGLFVGDESGFDDPRAPELAPGAGDWRLLLQRDSDPDGVTWGDSGMLYFWIRHADLRNARFEAAWCVLQCY